MCSVAADAMARLCEHCGQWVGTDAEAFANPEKMVADALEHMAQHPDLHARIADLTMKAAVAKEEGNVDLFRQYTHEYNLLWLLSTQESQPDLTHADRVEQAHTSAKSAVIMAFDPIVAAANERANDAIIQLSMIAMGQKGDMIVSAREFLTATTEAQQRLREHPDLMEVYSQGAPPADMYARSSLRSILAAMSHIPIEARERIHEELLGSVRVDASTRGCPNCAAPLTGEDVQSGACPYCSISLLSTAGA
ncbi:MAG: hypothetical protein JKY56_12130 [Kofleriaceae bacterium]|nr:hypothetical protein [Kofleriaceae bacterium]